MNWYLVTTQHDAFARGDVVALEGGGREAELEQRGYLKFLAVVVDDVAPMPPQVQPEWLAEEPATKKAATTPKRGRSGKSFEAGPPQSDGVQPVPGDEARGGDLPTD
jgi:hypothetical protein